MTIFTRNKTLGLAAAVIASCLSIWAAAAFTRPRPNKVPDAPGMKVGETTVELAVTKAQLGRISAMVEAHAIPAKDELAADQQLKQAQVSLRAAQSKLSS